MGIDATSRVELAAKLIRTHEEYQVFAFLSVDQPRLTERYLANLPRARRLTLHRFVETLIRDGILRDVPGTDVDRTVLLRLSSGDSLVVCLAEPRCAGISRVTGPVILKHDGVTEEISHPVELADLLEDLAFTSRSWRWVRQALAESTANLALSYSAAQARAEYLRGIAGEGDDLIDFAVRRSRTTQDTAAALFFEGVCADGHNLHPCGRMRLGFSPADSYRYTAECGGTTDLRFVAVASHRLLHTTDSCGRDVGALIFDHFPEVAVQAHSALARKGLLASSYSFIPVHPWQYEHVIRRTYEREIQDREVVPLDGVVLQATPTTAVRTVVTRCGRHGRRLVIKAALDVLITSTRRNMSPGTTYNGPRLSRLLAHIATADQDVAARMRPVVELAGTAFCHTSRPDSAGMRDLSVLVREDPADHASDGDVVIPGCALYSDSPLGDGSVLDALVSKRALDHRFTPATAAVEFWRNYVDLLVPAVLCHLTRYGIGLEAHLQNTLLVCRGSTIQRILIRDFGGIRVHLDRLHLAGLKYEPLPATVTTAPEIDAVRTKVAHTLLRDNLADLALRLATRFGISERLLWRMVHHSMDRTFSAIGSRCDPRHIHADRTALYAPFLPHKAFVEMMLRPGTGDVYRQTPNPIARFA